MEDLDLHNLHQKKMSVGKEVLTNGGRDPWIITDVLGDGKV